ncbi:uncharacterized protein LOC131015056 [Salvia miltiorrhiza]|uniref:uncharacterized protein LOC131015056 n=1 Tax=Salvia miltiorrhiza TaxID=226208 RepID=UPI0025AD79D7|nr:uncharacterized protein LOC131015056 [Salvia miltiorrhiza]
MAQKKAKKNGKGEVPKDAEEDDGWTKVTYRKGRSQTRRDVRSAPPSNRKKTPGHKSKPPPPQRQQEHKKVYVPVKKPPPPPNTHIRFPSPTPSFDGMVEDWEDRFECEEDNQSQHRDEEQDQNQEGTCLVGETTPPDRVRSPSARHASSAGYSYSATSTPASTRVEACALARVETPISSPSISAGGDLVDVPAPSASANTAFVAMSNDDP